jgi:hypothetical protein
MILCLDLNCSVPRTTHPPSHPPGLRRVASGPRTGRSCSVGAGAICTIRQTLFRRAIGQSIGRDIRAAAQTSVATPPRVLSQPCRDMIVVCQATERSTVVNFKGSHFAREIVLWGVRWYVA